MWEIQQFWGTTDFHSCFFPTMEVIGAPKQCRNIFLCVQKNKEMYTGFGTIKGE